MLLPLVLASTTLLGTNDGPARDTSKGNSLLRGCQAELRLMDLASLDDAPPMDLINGAYCLGYLNGFTASLPTAAATVCTHDDSITALVRAYVSFMNRNPRFLDEDKRLGLRLALEDAYPCPAGERGSR